MIYEIHNYYYDPDKFEAFVEWGKGEVNTFLKTHLDVVGIWFSNGQPPEFAGADPTPLKYGAPNITWIIRWESMEQRKQTWEAVSGEFQKIWATHPDPDAYLHMQVSFAEKI